MARTTLILAKNISEANSYAKLAGLQRFTYRSVRNAGAIRGVRNAEVHVLPSFLKRPDRHTIISALRMAKTLEIFYVDPDDLREPAERPELTDALLDEAYELNEEIDTYLVHLQADQQCAFDPTPADDSNGANMVAEGGPDYVTAVETDAEGEPVAVEATASGRIDILEDLAAEADKAEVVPPETPEVSEIVPPEPVDRSGQRRTRCKDCGSLHYKDEACPKTDDSAPPAAPAPTADFF